jgi:alpha-D-xyloside xylohydrolase
MELRIYPGANGTFKFYEDANDNYNYEKGEYATFNFTWNDANKQLNISARKGSFPGMLQKRIFNIVVVSDTHGIGVNEEKADKIIKYSGKSIAVKI